MRVLPESICQDKMGFHNALWLYQYQQEQPAGKRHEQVALKLTC